MKLGAALLEVVNDRVVQVGLRRALEHAQHARLGADRKEHEDGEHATRRDVVAIEEPQRIDDRIPHAIER